VKTQETIPVFGVGAWWLLGRTHLHRLRRKKRKSDSKLEKQSTARLANQYASPESRLIQILPFAGRKDALEDGVFPPTDGNQVEFLVDAHCAAGLVVSLSHASGTGQWSVSRKWRKFCQTK
jgi:hypothetical protein